MSCSKCEELPACSIVTVRGTRMRSATPKISQASENRFSVRLQAPPSFHTLCLSSLAQSKMKTMLEATSVTFCCYETRIVISASSTTTTTSTTTEVQPSVTGDSLTYYWASQSWHVTYSMSEALFRIFCSCLTVKPSCQQEFRSRLKEKKWEKESVCVCDLLKSNYSSALWLQQSHPDCSLGLH